METVRTRDTQLTRTTSHDHPPHGTCTLPSSANWTSFCKCALPRQYTSLFSHSVYSILQALREFYSREEAEPGPYLEVAFDRDEVALEVEEDGVTLDNGWSLVPLFCPTSVRHVLYCIYYIPQ